ncbi:uncharacterized protein LOC131041905 isoform X2 [Cryptomeria japonica]|uniref:uncharacterized protein LOC131041905 isoform X2 n=1 Tax=Cryptomeria japonica TaxID=3369 RepID=UPI0027DA895C|nr:uncharacterized protein LOC131041905 isoform X2 [Cryptomeria japonica]
MASSEGENKKIQIYSTPTDVISTFWKEKYEKDAKKYWDIFYKRHENRFFKDRHYLDKEWGPYFFLLNLASYDIEGSIIFTIRHFLHLKRWLKELCRLSNSPGSAAMEATFRNNAVLEVGCGAGNTVFPLLSSFPDLFVYACDFSPRAIDLVKAHKDYKEEQVHAFVCDVTADELTVEIPPASVDIVTMIFVLSAVLPEKMSQAVQNIRRVLKERLTSKEQKISENFYVRGDGTRVFYFSEEALASLFTSNGFVSEKIEVHCKRIENRSRELVMDRRWIQGAFCSSNVGLSPLQSDVQKEKEEDSKYKSITWDAHDQTGVHSSLEETDDVVEVDLSETIGMEMLGGVPSANEVFDILIGGQAYNLKCLSKEYQHTCKSTGFMLWESARMLSPLLATNPDIFSGKNVLELGCGSAGICSMVAAKSSKLVVATDGDLAVMDLLTENIKANSQHWSPSKLLCERLEWGNKAHIDAARSLCPQGFDVIIGTDVVYVEDAIIPLFETAKALVSTGEIGMLRPAVILCHVIRRVHEGYIISAASQYGFHLEDKWPSDNDECMKNSLIASWFPDDSCRDLFLQSALRIMYFN